MKVVVALVHGLGVEQTGDQCSYGGVVEEVKLPLGGVIHHPL